MIPKIIWQTHEKKYNDLPAFQNNIIGTWKNLNPGWEHSYVDAEERCETVKKYNDFLYSCYIELDNIHKSDIWRLIAIYTHGGFYADMDSICLETIEYSIGKGYKGEELICSSKGFQHSGINNSNFGAIKNSKIIKSIIDSLILQFKDIKIEDVPKLGFGFPENYTFSKIAQDNENLIYFNNKYFSHSEVHKTSFDINRHVSFNGKIINYKTLCENNNFPIYYI